MTVNLMKHLMDNQDKLFPDVLDSWNWKDQEIKRGVNIRKEVLFLNNDN